MKYLLILALCIVSSNSLADYKIILGSESSNIQIPEPEKWQAPSGEPALHPNGVTVTCLDMPPLEWFTLNGKNYRVAPDNISSVSQYGNYACTSNVTSLANVFRDQTDFNEDISHWDTSNVTNMGNAFYLARSFNQDISHWDTSNVTNMNGIFRAAKDFDQDIGNWDVSNVTGMVYAFTAAENFNQDIGDWDVSSVTDMRYMFKSADRFNQDIGGWDVSNVTDMYQMFRVALAFNRDLSGWCVLDIATKPSLFDDNTPSWVLPQPNWGEPCN